jgi:Mn-dependent DtxR family transcriptional regulator
VLLVTKLDRDALIGEAARFEGAELVYANLDESTIDRLKEALGDTHSETHTDPTPAPNA